MSDTKFKFNLDFQEDLLSYTVQDKYGYKALQLYDDTYFTTVEHSVIAYTLKRYFKANNKLPMLSIFLEELNKTYNSPRFRDLITNDDIKEINGIGRAIFSKQVHDGDEILKLTDKFSQYVELKDVLENIDLQNFDDYENFSRGVQKAIKPRFETNKVVTSTYLIANIRDRQLERQVRPSVLPTPIKQINDITNAGGYEKGSIIVILDKPKQFKTGAVINIAKGYVRMGKNVVFFDMENGLDSIAARLEQSISNLNKKELLSGEHDQKIQKKLRKYKRVGGEILIKRLPAYSSVNDMKACLDEEYRETGFRPHVLIADYAALMSCTTGKKDDTERISDVYLDLANLGQEYDIEHIYTPHHVTKDGYSRESTRYAIKDIAKCTDIVRHVHAIIGLNRNQEEYENDVLRMELVVQRDGFPSGRALFHMNGENQSITEFTRAQRKMYDEQTADPSEDTQPDKPRRTRRNTDMDGE